MHLFIKACLFAALQFAFKFQIKPETFKPAETNQRMEIITNEVTKILPSPSNLSLRFNIELISFRSSTGGW